MVEENEADEDDEKEKVMQFKKGKFYENLESLLVERKKQKKKKVIYYIHLI